MTSRFQFISTHRAFWSVKRLCHVLAVSRSGFYRWSATQPARQARAAADQVLAGQISRVHAASGGTYGSPRVTTELHAQGVRVNRKRVERVMRRCGVIGLHLRRRKPATTIPDRAAPPLPDLVRRDFSPGGPLGRWCGDITALPTRSGWVYLATVIDISSRRLIGWSVNTHMRTDLVTDALNAAVTTRGGQVAGVVFHSDRGAQYRSHDFTNTCHQHGIRQSMGRTGSSYDNALAEAFFATLKRELGVHHHRWTSPTQARRDIFTWIAFYNHRRRHTTLGHHSPTHYEHTLTPTTLQPTTS